MENWLVHHDLRAPDFGTPRVRLYAEALAMTSWAESRGCPRVVLSEHHGVDDGYLPSPFVFGAAVAARTTTIRIMVSALVLTLRDPIATAEDVAVLDVLSDGRVELTVVPGYVAEEFAMFGVPFEGRGTLFEEKLQAFTQALTGGPTTYLGRTVTVTPPPVQRPRPFLIVGGAAPRRAARMGDAFLPAVPDETLAADYVAECRRLGKGDGILLWPAGPMWVFVTDDPDRTWAELGRHALHEANGYGRWAAAAPGASPYVPVESVEELRRSDRYAVVTPDRCIALARDMDPRSAIQLKPLVGGLDPDIGWRSLELFADKVLPALAVPPPSGR
jgi:alkanesulfonate monooxygenase SsuD/methylene tetrahydromethanopterin reductase-like flavin-dependent oxidoreductase (luciferase family)